MGQTWSKHWTGFAVNYCGASIGYSWIFYCVFKAMIKKSIDNDTNKEVIALDYATNTISTINALITMFCGFTNIILHSSTFFDPKNIVINDRIETFPKLTFFGYAYFIAYLIIDTIGHLIICRKYGFKNISKNKTIQVILHHLLTSLQFILIQIPKPIYLWPLYNFVLIMETSTIPLNLKWFSKYFKWSKSTSDFIDYSFLFTWFAVRMMALLCILIITIKVWDEALMKMPKYKFIVGVSVLALGYLPQIYWSGMIIKNVYNIKHKKNALKSNVIHGQKMKTLSGQ